MQVREIASPWVQTDLLGSNNEPRAMPLAEFIEKTMRVLRTDAEEVLVERAKPLRNNAGPDESSFVFQFNDMMANPMTVWFAACVTGFPRSPTMIAVES